VKVNLGLRLNLIPGLNFLLIYALSAALKDDVASRFSTLLSDVFPTALANAVVNLIDIIGESRNIARFY